MLDPLVRVVHRDRLGSSQRAGRFFLGALESLEACVDAFPTRADEVDEEREIVHSSVPLGEELADHLASVATAIESIADRAPETRALERRIDELVGWVDVAADERAEVSSELSRLAAILEVERAAVRSRLDSLAASQELAIGAIPADELERRVTGVDGRLEAIERERAALAARVDRLTSAFDTERGSFQTQLEALATALSWTSPKSTVDERLDELDSRMERLELQEAAVASKVAHATTLVPAALRSLDRKSTRLNSSH